MARPEEMAKLAQRTVSDFDARRDGDAARHTAVAKLQNDTITMLAKFDADHAAMSKAMRADWAAFNQKRAKEHAEFKAQVKARVREMANDSAQTRAAWRGMAETLQKKRAGAKPAPAPTKPTVKTTPTPGAKESPKTQA